jgi:hypothetical protein
MTGNNPDVGGSFLSSRRAWCPAHSVALAPCEKDGRIMHRLLGLLVLGLVVTLGFGSIGGCKKGDDKKDEKKGGDSGSKKLTVTAEGPAEVKQGENADITIKIAREGFDEDVSVSGKDDKGVNISAGKVAKGKTDFKTNVMVGKDAAEGEHKVVITAEGGGKEATTTLKVIVKMK